MRQEELVVDFQLRDTNLKAGIRDHFSEGEIIESSAFSGTEIITVIITSSVLALDKILNFFIQNRKQLKETSIKISKEEISLSGFTNEEIESFIEGGSIQKIREQMGLKDEE